MSAGSRSLADTTHWSTAAHHAGAGPSSSSSSSLAAGAGLQQPPLPSRRGSVAHHNAAAGLRVDCGGDSRRSGTGDGGGGGGGDDSIGRKTSRDAGSGGATAMFSTDYGSPPRRTMGGVDVTGQARRGVRAGGNHHSDECEYEALGNRSVGAPTPTSSSSYGGGPKDEAAAAALAGVGNGRRESDFSTEDGYSGGLDAGYRVQAISPEYGVDAAACGDYDGDDTGGMGGSNEGSVGLDTRSEGTRGVLKMKSEAGGLEQLPTWSETKTKVRLGAGQVQPWTWLPRPLPSSLPGVRPFY